MDTVKIRYVGKSAPYTDSLFDTGTWSKRGEVKEVPREVAPFMLYHDDVYRDARPVVARNKDPIEPKKRERNYHVKKDFEPPLPALAYMTKGDMARYNSVNFGEQLDPSKMTAPQMRQKIVSNMRERG